MNHYVVWGSGVAGVAVSIAVYAVTGSALGAALALLSIVVLLSACCVIQRFLRTPSLVDPPAGEEGSSSAASRKVEDSQSLAELMLEQGRYTLLLRPQIAESIPADLLRQAQQRLDEQMTLVPSGECIVGKGSCESGDVPEHLEGRVVRVEGYYLDRYQVTNQEYARFVAAGGYEQLSLWDPEIVPALLDFVDESGMPGPRYWQSGKYLPGRAKHPVVGVCWYEAAAYARWVGKRLPTDPEWVKAGSWPVPLPGSRPVQRKFPWGDAFDAHRVNLWGCGSGATVPVDQYDDGMSVGGAYQLIGNVWEWTSSRFGAWQASSKPLILDASMRSVRGGAYDTYFEQQATCDFQSGDKATARKRNIGFRCAIGLCDLIPDQSMQEDDRPQQVESPEEQLAEVTP